MKFLFDYFPIVCFFIAFKFFGIYIATATMMVASLLQVGVFWLKHRRVEKLHLIILILVFILGGSTLIFHKEIFIKWKPSIVYWIFSIALLASHWSQKTILSRMIGDKINLPNKIWTRLNFSWGIFFLFLGFLNLYVVYHYSTNAWVNFKLFGTLGLTVVLVIAQAIYMSYYYAKSEKDHKIAED